MDRRDLHVALEPIVRAWIRATCTWESVPIGDHRYLVFSIDVAPDASLRAVLVRADGAGRLGIAAVAKDVVRIFHDGFDYRGTGPIKALLGYEDISKVFAGLSFRGGVTLEWLVARITEWDAMLAEHHQGDAACEQDPCCSAVERDRALKTALRA